MVRPIIFPIFVLAKDCGEISEYISFEKLQRQLEEIDVENNEYEAWDKHGEPLRLFVKKMPTWLEIEPMAESSISLRDAILAYGNSVGICLSDEEVADFSEALRTISRSKALRKRD